MSEGQGEKLINIEELGLVVDWLRNSSDRQALMRKAQHKYGSLLKNLSPGQIYHKASSFNTRVALKQQFCAKKPKYSTEYWNFGQHKIFVWVSVYYCLQEKIELSQMNNSHFEVLQRIFMSKSFEFIKYQQRCVLYSHNKQNPEWKEEEIEIFFELMREKGFRNEWKRLSFSLFCVSQGRFFRPMQQCREKWLNYLNPNIKKEKWTIEEDIKLFSLIDEYGCKWSRIAKQFQEARTEHMVKNRYNYYKKHWRKSNTSEGFAQIRPKILFALREKRLSKKFRDGRVCHNVYCEYFEEIINEINAAQPMLQSCDSDSAYNPDDDSVIDRRNQQQMIEEFQNLIIKEKPIIPQVTQLQLEIKQKEPEVEIEQQEEEVVPHMDDILEMQNMGSYWQGREMKYGDYSPLGYEGYYSQQNENIKSAVDDVLKVLGCEHYQAIFQNDEWIKELEEKKTLEWIQ